VAISCESYERFLEGLCTECNKDEHVCIKFGFQSQSSYDKLSLKSHIDPLYLLTSSASPYCLVHYKISIKLANETVHQGDVGSLRIKFIFEDNTTSDAINLTNRMDFRAGNVYSFFVTDRSMQESIKSTKIIYNYELNLIRLKNPEIFVEFIEIQSMEYGGKFRFCSKNAEPLVNGFASEFKNEFCYF
jgi:hypothetical protein